MSNFSSLYITYEKDPCLTNWFDDYSIHYTSIYVCWLLVAHYLKLCSLGAVDSPIYSEEDEKRALLLSTATNINLPIKSPSRSLFRIVVLRTSQSPSLYPLRYSRTTSLASPPPLSLSFAYFQNKTRSSNEKRNRVLTLHCIYPAASRSIPLPSRFF